MYFNGIAICSMQAAAFLYNLFQWSFQCLILSFALLNPQLLLRVFRMKILYLLQCSHDDAAQHNKALLLNASNSKFSQLHHRYLGSADKCRSIAFSTGSALSSFNVCRIQTNRKNASTTSVDLSITMTPQFSNHSRVLISRNTLL